MSLSHILCGAFGFLLGSAGVAHGSRKRNPLSFALGLMFLLAGAAAVFMALVDRAVEEAEEEEDEEEAEAEAEEAEAAAEAAQAVDDAEEAEAAAVEVTEEAAEAAKEAEDAE